MLPLEDLVRHIRRQRIILGLTQAQLAMEADSSQSLVAKLERGRLNPSYETVRRIMEALDRLSLQEEPTAGGLMRRNPLCATADEALGTALARMKQKGYSQLPVADGGTPVGALSDASILRRLDEGVDMETIRSQPVRMTMGPAYPTVEPSARRRTLVELLRDRQAVVVMEHGRIVGLITKSDLW